MLCVFLLALLSCPSVLIASSDDEIDTAIANLDVPEIIERYGYPSEVHEVTTSDGYILQMHRIPHGRDSNYDPAVKRPVVLLLHGLLSSSADYIIMGPKHSLGFLLAEEGYDVWLGNARGNYYSRRHTTLNPDGSGSFWDYDWEEIGLYDLAAMVDKVLNVTGEESIHYIGHSQGTTIFFVLNSMKPEYNAKFKTVHLLAPIGYMNNFPSEDIADLAEYSTLLYSASQLLGLGEVMPREGTFTESEDGEVGCVNNIFSSLCESMIELVDAQAGVSFDEAYIPIIRGHFPSGSSLKQFAHYGQVISNKRFARWEFAMNTVNLVNYGSRQPPTYDLSKVTAQVVLHYSVADSLSSEEDVLEMAEALPNVTVRRIPNDHFSHFDFAWSENAKQILYETIVIKVESYETAKYQD